MKDMTISRRLSGSFSTSSACLSDTLALIAAAIVSASSPASSMSPSCSAASSPSFLLSFAYSPNCSTTWRIMATTSLPDAVTASFMATAASTYSPRSLSCSSCARELPWTSTRTVPSGSLSNWSTCATTPTSNRSSRSGSSHPGSSCARRKMSLLPSIAASSAATDLSRPTNSGTTMPGNTTMSRRGRRG